MKKNIYLMYIIGFLQGMVFYGPIATLYRQANQVSVFQITIIESICLFLCLLLEIPWGVLADKIGYKKTMIFCSSLCFLSKCVFWQATGFWWFLLERVMLAVVISGLSGVDTSIIFMSCEKGKSHKVFGIYNSLQMAGLLIAAVIFSVFIKNNYKMAGGFTVISYGLAALAAFGLAEVKESKTQEFSVMEFKGMLKNTFKNKNLLLLLLAIAFLSETHQTITVFLSQIQYDKAGLSNSAIGYIYVFVTLVGMLGFCSSWWTKKLGEKLSGILFFSGAAVSCVVLANTTQAGYSIVGILVLRIINSFFQPFQMELQNRQVSTNNRATQLSIYAMIVTSIGIGTNLIFGMLSKISLSASFIFGSFLCGVGLFLFCIWDKNKLYK